MTRIPKHDDFDLTLCEMSIFGGIEWSPELFRIYGLEPTSTTPTIREYLNCIHPEDRELMANLIKRILANASPLHGGHLINAFVFPTLELFMTVYPTALHKQLDEVIGSN